jgi:thiazole/oxazole-forming peptide maturase SagC family component
LTSLRKSKVGVVGSNQLKTVIQNSLQSMGINPLEDIHLLFVEREKNEGGQKELVKALKGLDILIACQESEGFGFFETINELCLESDTRWLRVAIEGTTVSLGPTFVPFQTACYTCYDRRIASNLPDPEDYRAYQQQISSDNGSGNGGYFPPLWSLAASHTTIEIARIISGFAPPKTMGRFYLIEGMSPDAVGHEVLRLPRCPACSRRGPKKQAWDRSASSNEKL